MEYLKRLLPFARPYRRRIAWVLLFTIGALVTNLMVPQLLGFAVDRGVIALDLQATRFWCLMLVGVAALRSLFFYLQGVYQGMIGTDAVRDLQGRDVARGITRYNSADARRIAGEKSDQIEKILGYDYAPMLIHADDLVVR